MEVGLHGRAMGTMVTTFDESLGVARKAAIGGLNDHTERLRSGESLEGSLQQCIR